MKNIERNVPYEPEVLDKLHAVQIEMLNDLDEICKKNNLEYSGAFLNTTRLKLQIIIFC